MRQTFRLTVLLIFTAFFSDAQTDQCGVNAFIDNVKKINPELYTKVQKYEREFEEKVSQNKLRYSNGQNSFEPKILSERNGGLSAVQSLCGYNNSYVGFGAAPTVLGSTLTATNMYGGDYITVNNMIAGRTYRVSTCGNNDFDTQITIYTAGGASIVAHNDDLCANNQSEIYFTPFTTGNYDILLDEYDCQSTFIVSTTLEVQLVYTQDPVITIPVVVHVVWNTTAENISDAQINSQINVLNQDFRRLNSDISNAPVAFKGFAADTRYQFCLAQQDPNGLPTNGITRTFTNITQFNGPPDTSVWFTSTGGHDSWDRTKYLNIWVCDLPGLPSPGLIGFGTFPWLGLAVPEADGVISDYQAFGTIGTAVAPFNLGRNTTHEVGHYLGLRHIWGDENACAGSDSCLDTPNQTINSSGTPTFPLTDACSPNYPGVMFNNYMDYSDDISKNMFTFFQFVRTDAAIRNGGIRASLATSPGCTPSSSAINENFLDKLITISPNPNSGKFIIAQSRLINNLNVEVTDVLGNIIYQNILTEFKTVVNIQTASGIYFVRFSADRNASTRKIVIE